MSNAAGSLVYELPRSNFTRSRTDEHHNASIQSERNGSLMAIAMRANGLSELHVVSIAVALGYTALVATLLSRMV